MADADGAPRLVFDGPEPRTCPLGHGQVWTVGRSFDNQIAIDDSSISRRHAMLQLLEGGAIVLVDLGSSNGTFVNDRRVSVPVTLRDGDRVSFGKTACRFLTQVAAPPLAPATLLTMTGGTQILQVRRLLTVVVLDVRGFTTMTRLMSEQTLSAVMSHWFQRAASITKKRGGWVDKYIGDAVMALWAHDETGPDLQAGTWLSAIADMLMMTAIVHERFQLPSRLEVGVGVNTGFAVMSHTGPRDHPDYTAFGDTVNAAFRLESATRAIGRDVLIGESSWRALPSEAAKDAFTRVTVQLKGYDGPTVAYAIDADALIALAGPADDKTGRI